MCSCLGVFGAAAGEDGDGSQKMRVLVCLHGLGIGGSDGDTILTTHQSVGFFSGPLQWLLSDPSR